MSESKYPNIVDKVRQKESTKLSYKRNDFSKHYISSYKLEEIKFVNGILLSNIISKENFLISNLNKYCKQNKNDFATQLELSKEKAKKNIFELGVHFFYYTSFYSEDMSFQMKAKDEGFTIYVDPKVIVGHEKNLILI